MSYELNECRICYGDASTEPFVNACKCTGSMKYVHASCIEMWRSSLPNRQEKCDVCKSHYKGRVVNPTTVPKLKFIKQILTCLSFTFIKFMSLYIPFLLMCFCFQKFYHQEVFEIDETLDTWRIYLLDGHYNICAIMGRILEVALTITSIFYGTTHTYHSSTRYIGAPDLLSEEESTYHAIGIISIYVAFLVYTKKQWDTYSYLTYKPLSKREYDIMM